MFIIQVISNKKIKHYFCPETQLVQIIENSTAVELGLTIIRLTNQDEIITTESASVLMKRIENEVPTPSQGMV
jgi:hypothetical protein